MFNFLFSFSFNCFQLPSFPPLFFPFFLFCFLLKETLRILKKHLKPRKQLQRWKRVSSISWLASTETSIKMTQIFYFISRQFLHNISIEEIIFVKFWTYGTAYSKSVTDVFHKCTGVPIILSTGTRHWIWSSIEHVVATQSCTVEFPK